MKSFAMTLFYWLATASLLTATAVTSAQPYAIKPVRLIVPFPSGGVTDIVGRIIAQNLALRLGQSVVVDNRSGAAGAIGAQAAARATPDGYTLLMGTATHAINATLMSEPGYDLLRDFSAVSLIASVPLLLAVHPSVPATNIQELTTFAKSQQAGLNYASGSSGSASHLAGEMLKIATETNLTHIPYKGGGPALQDLISGQVTFMFENMPSILPQVRNGRLRGLAVTGAKRSDAAPDLPTMIEAGFPNFEIGSWYGVFAPAKTPSAVLATLSTEILNALGTTQMQSELRAQGADPKDTSSAAFADFVQAEVKKWGELIKTSGLKP
jgi:tripartite-type tricarboxylate transporter receptor subunit TctC